MPFPFDNFGRPYTPSGAIIYTFYTKAALLAGEYAKLNSAGHAVKADLNAGDVPIGLVEQNAKSNRVAVLCQFLKIDTVPANGTAAILPQQLLTVNTSGKYIRTAAAGKTLVAIALTPLASGDGDITVGILPTPIISEA